jgi:hypothetical protein
MARHEMYLKRVNVDRDWPDVAALHERPLVVAAEESDVVHAVRRRPHHLGRPEGKAFLLRVHLHRKRKSRDRDSRLERSNYANKLFRFVQHYATQLGLIIFLVARCRTTQN